MRIDQTADLRRKHERHPAEGMRCDLGQVCDLSASGMRLLCKGKPPLSVGQMTTLKLSFSDGALTLSGQAMWLRKVRLRRFEVGIRFVNVKPAVTKALESLARFGFIGGPGGAPAAGHSINERKRKKFRIKASINLPDYYRILGVTPDADADQIKRHFRLAASKCHPDVAGNDPQAAEKFAQVHEAYEVLRDPDKRAMYDLRTAA